MPLPWCLLCIAVLLLLVCLPPVSAGDFQLGDGTFDVRISAESGGIASLKLVGDTYDTDMVWPGATLGQVRTRSRAPGESWRWGSTAGSADVRRVQHDGNVATVSYAGDSSGEEGIRGFSLVSRYELKRTGLVWSLTFRNRRDEPLEMGDIALQLPFNTDYQAGGEQAFTKSVIRHAFVSGDGSWFFLQRPNGEGPYVVMTPAAGTHLEYYTDTFRNKEFGYQAYIHAAVQSQDDAGGVWRQPVTSKVLAPAGKRGDSVTYTFRFRRAEDYEGVRDRIVQDGLVDVEAVPGMVVPNDLEALVALRTKQRIVGVDAEFPAETSIEFVAKKGPETSIYRVRFHRLGENRLTVTFGAGRKLYLEFFSTQPVETLIKKRAAFIVDRQQHRDPSKWYDGLYSVWDMEDKVLRSPDDTGGLRAYMVGGSDDPTNCKAPLLAYKNLSFPDREEIASIEHYIAKFLWGGMQRRDDEPPFPYGIYGIDNWYVNRNSDEGFDSNGKGKGHIWRSFDYPAIFALYFQMHRIATEYPDLVKHLDADGYLERAYRTALAYFEVPWNIKGWWGGYADWSYTTGVYNELVIPDILDTLRAKGRGADADRLALEWDKKVKYFIYDNQHAFGSEYPFDSTCFESTHAAAKWAVERGLKPDQNLWEDKEGHVFSHPNVSDAANRDYLERQMRANIADRGWLEPAYYILGSDIRAMGTTSYLLSYMAQMGGWAVLDYAMHFSKTPAEHVRLGYASYLSSYALINAGDRASNFGFWFPGPENDGAAGWGFEPLKVGRPWYGLKMNRGAWKYDGEIDHGYLGALRSAATIVVDDPVFGLFAYGGTLSTSKGAVKVVPKDGLRQRLHFLDAKARLSLEMRRDGFVDAKVYRRADGAVSRVDFTLENRTGDAHETMMEITGLPLGAWKVADGTGTHQEVVSAKGPLPVRLRVSAGPKTRISIARQGA